MPLSAFPNLRSRIALLLAGLALVLPMPMLAAEEDYTDAYRRLVEQRSPSVVPVKYVITVAAGGQGSATRTGRRASWSPPMAWCWCRRGR